MHSEATKRKISKALKGRPNSHKIYPNRDAKWKAWRQRTKKAIHDLLGGKCVRCGFEDSRALQIDHVNGGGAEEVKATTGNYQVMILRSILSGSKKYQLLCANCNWIKRVERNEVRNNKIKKQ